MKHLNDSERSFLAQALVLAADHYVGFAVDCKAVAGGDRLQAQFLKQAKDIRYLAMLFDDSDAASIDVSADADALEALKGMAAQITDQQFAERVR